MKQSVTTLLLLLFAACAVFAEEHTIAIVKSGSAAPYETAIAGLREEISRSSLSARIDEYDSANAIPASSQPQIIVAVGSRAVDLISKTRPGAPIVYMMVMKPEAPQPNITGVSLGISPRKQFGLCKKILPGLQRIGVLYDPAQTRELVEQSINEASELNIKIIAVKVSKIAEIYNDVRELGPRVDALWIIPDPTVYTPQTAEDILLYSLRDRVPVIGLSSYYVKAGALCSFSCSYHSIGMQTAKMVVKILNGEPVSHIPPEEPETIETSLNLIAAERLGITIPNAIIQGATNVYK